MKTFVLTLAIVTVLALSVASVFFAANGEPPRGSCPPDYELHAVGQHEEHDHHVGLTVDLYRDNRICVKHLSAGGHVHMDNVVRD